MKDALRAAKPAAVTWSSVLGGLGVLFLVGIIGVAGLKSTGSNVNSLLQRVANTLDTVGGTGSFRKGAASATPMATAPATIPPRPKRK